MDGAAQGEQSVLKTETGAAQTRESSILTPSASGPFNGRMPACRAENSSSILARTVNASQANAELHCALNADMPGSNPGRRTIMPMNAKRRARRFSGGS